MIGRLVADWKSWMYILRNYASILQMYTKQVILCNFINVIIVMKTSLIRQPFFYKKKLGFFFTSIHVKISFDLFSPFTISKYNSTLTPDEQARFDRFQIVAFFQNRPTVCRSSGDHRLTLYRWESHETRGPRRATVAHLSTINASKIWLRNGTKNNNTSSYMFQDHSYAFSLLL